MNKAKRKYGSGKCSKCGKVFSMGATGVVIDDKEYCDRCAGAVRNKNGQLKHVTKEGW